jgi:hypothetical protein
MSLAKYLSVSLIAISAGAASAGEFYQNASPQTLTQNGIEQGQATHVTFPTLQYNGTAGQFIGSFGSGADAFLRFFCFEAQGAGGPAEYTLHTAPPPLDAAKYESLQRLYDRFYPTHGFTDFYNAGQTSFGHFDGGIAIGSSGATDAAAFQLAVWEIVFGTGLAAPGPNPYAAETTAMLADLVNSTGYQNWIIYTFTNDSQQDFVTATLRVPEPGSLALAGLALAGLGFVRRRRS